MFQKNRKKGAVIVPNLLADILAAELNGLLDVGHYYATTDQTEERIGRAVLVNKIEWDVLSSDVAAAVLVEKNRAMGVENQIAGNLASEVQRATTAEAQIAQNLAAEVSRATAAEGTIASNLAAEIARATAAEGVIAGNLVTETNRAIAAENAIAGNLAAEITRATGRENTIETNYQAADAQIVTNLTTQLNAAVEALKDDRVTSFSGVTYAQGQDFTAVSLTGNSPKEGVHLYKFTSANTNNTAVVSGLPGGAANLNLTYNDIVKITVDGGVITNVELIDDALKAKLVLLDAAIADLQAATTPGAIRAHFTASGWATLVNGLIDVSPSAEPTNDLKTSTVDGKAFLDVDQAKTTAGPSGETTVQQQFVDLWATVANMTTNGVGGAANGVQKVGNNIELGGNPLTKDTVIAGPHILTLGANVTVVDGVLKLPIFEVGAGNVRTVKTTDKVEVWFDSKGINYEFPAVPNQ